MHRIANAIEPKSGEGRARILSRSSISTSTLHADYFANRMSFEEFDRIWADIAACLGLPPDRLRPDDRFDYELSWIGNSLGYSDALVELSQRITRHAEESGETVATRKLHSLQEVVEALATKMPTKSV